MKTRSPLILAPLAVALGALIQPLANASAQAPALSGTILTLAGKGVFGFSGDGGPGLPARQRRQSAGDVCRCQSPRPAWGPGLDESVGGQWLHRRRSASHSAATGSSVGAGRRQFSIRLRPSCGRIVHGAGGHQRRVAQERLDRNRSGGGGSSRPVPVHRSRRDQPRAAFLPRGVTVSLLMARSWGSSYCLRESKSPMKPRLRCAAPWSPVVAGLVLMLPGCGLAVDLLDPEPPVARLWTAARTAARA